MTAKQAATLKALVDYPRTAWLAATMLKISEGAAARRLRRLEDRGLVRRTYPAGPAAVWELTAEGRALVK